MRYIGFIFALCLSIQAIASNTITLSSVSGTPQTEVEVVVSLDNSDAIVALEMVLPLGEHLSYVTNSAVLATARSNGHMLSAAQVGQELRIYVYSFSQNALNGNTGELLTFRLQLGNEPADYALAPIVVLSDAAGASIDGSVQAGSVAIQAPKLQIVNTQIDYGHIPIREVYTQELFLENVGNLPLVIEDITTTDPLLMPLQTALTIEAGQTASVSIEYAPVVRGAISKEVLVKSNAINGDQVATIIADPFSVNELHVSTASGIADGIVTISLTMNNMEPIVAMQCAFKLPKQLEYVVNSLAVNATRNNGHQVLSTLRGDTLFLAIFSMTNQPLHANDGEIATFQLRLNGSSGTYYLKPIDVVLSNITEENMVSATSQGKVTIKAPSISGNTSLSFGNVPITEEAYATYSVRNNGSAPLVLERATFLAEGYSIVEELPIMIANYQTTTITVAYQPSEEGNFSTTMNIYTNDPNNRLKTVALSGHVYEPNTLILNGQNNQDDTYTLSVALDNYTDIVAVQYDLHWRNDMTTSQSAFVPSARMQKHNAVVTPLDEDSYRIIIYSMSNATIAGHDGELHQLVFTSQGEANYCGSTISIDNIVLSNAAGGDKTSAKSVTLRAEQTQWVNDTAIACDEYVWNGKTYTESGMYIDTIPSSLGCDSIVTLHLTILGYEPYRLTLDGESRPDSTYLVSIGLENYDDVVGVQYDLHWRSDMTTSQSAFTPSMRMRNHNYNVIPLDEDSYRIIIYSLSNAKLLGNEGELNQLIFSPQEDKSTHQLISKKQMANSQIGVLDCENARIPINYVVDASKDIKVVFKMTVDYCENETGLGNTGAWAGGMSSWFNADRQTFNILCGNVVDDYAFDYTYGDAIEVTMTNGYYEFKNSQGGYKKIEFEPQNLYCSNSLVFCNKPCAWKGSVYYVKIYEDGQLVRNYLPQPDGTLKDFISGTIASPASGTITYREELVDITPIDKEQCYSTITIDNIVLSNANGTNKSSAKDVSLVAELMKWGEETITACDEYVWNGTTYTETGIYIDTIPSQAGCDSIVTLHLTINNSIITEQTEVVCDSYTWIDGKTYTESGTYYQYLQTIHGCDSTVVLHLTINNSVAIPYEVTACDSYTWSNGMTYTQSGVYYDSLKTIHGCDSVEILTLTINYSDTAYFSATACDSYVWHDERYTTSGTYEYLTQTIHGCDSLEVLTLTINNSITNEETEEVCDSYTWTDGKTYTESGTYYQYLQTIHGCDSTVVLHLTVNRSIEVPYEVTACDSYTWSNGMTYTQSGVYYDSLKTIHGCDSVEILTLTINYSDTAYFSATACDSYVWHDETYTTSGTYEYLTQTVNGCDSLEVLTLTINRSVTSEETYVSCDSYIWNGETYSESGEYVYTTVAANGCDSIVTLHLTILPDAATESETLALCPSELPYEWYGQSLTEEGTYSATEPYAGMECDSVIHELTLNVYVHTLPAAVTLPIVRMGEAIDVTIPTAEIQAHIAAETWYAPNALVAWYILENSDWATLTNEPIVAGIEEVTLKYAVETDCGIAESDKMVITVETTGLENIPTDVMGVYKVLRDNKIFIIRGGKAYSIMGHLVGDKSVIESREYEKRNEE